MATYEASTTYNTKNISINFIRDLLIEYGYEKVEIVREVGEFSIRGDILDAFINGYSNPFRINFFDLKIESIITFNPLSQRNIPNTKIADVNNFSIFDIAKYRKLIFTESSVKELEKKF